jgi:hypothetical protein
VSALSVAVPQHRDHTAGTRREGRERLVVVAAVVATLAVIAGPGIVGASGLLGGMSPRVEDPRLSDGARRVLDELPGAYAAAGTVVVPAATDRHVLWIGPIADSSIDGRVVDLGARGLVPFGTLPTSSTTPAWRSDVEPADRVFADVGPLHFGCAPSSSGGTCRGTVLVEHGGRWHALHGVEGRAGSPGGATATRVSVLGGGGEAGLWLGWMPEGAATAWATVVGDHSVRDVPGRTSQTDARGGAAMWWVRSSEPVSTVSFKDLRGRVVEQTAVGD